MPTPRRHGGAELVNIPLVAPGFRGLQTQQASGTIGPEWATALVNAVIDDNGRVASRKGYENVIVTAIASPFVHLDEYVRADGQTELVGVTAGGSFYRSTNGGATWSAPTGSATISLPNGGLFQNFNNQSWFFSAGVKPVYYDGTNIAQVSDSNAPMSNVGLAAFGRLWGVAADGHTLRYSALLEGANWTTNGAGFADHFNVWPGNDQIAAVREFNGSLVVFGRNSIVIWADGVGSALGIDPDTMYVADIIQGTGCISQHSIQYVDGDIWFLSQTGLQSLSRVIQEKSNPLNNLSTNVQDYLSRNVRASVLELLRSAYSSTHKVYLLSLSTGGGADAGQCFVFDTRGRLEDGSVRSLGTWSLRPKALVVRRNGELAFQSPATVANYNLYGTAQLDDGATFVFDYESGWLDLTKQGYLLIPKRFGGVFFSDNTVTVNFKWYLDFSQVATVRTKSFLGNTGAGEWGLSEWGLAEFGGGVSLRQGAVDAAKTGEYIKLGISANINNTILAVQQLDLFCKVGRYA